MKQWVVSACPEFTESQPSPLPSFSKATGLSTVGDGWRLARHGWIPVVRVQCVIKKRYTNPAEFPRSLTFPWPKSLSIASLSVYISLAHVSHQVLLHIHERLDTPLLPSDPSTPRSA